MDRRHDHHNQSTATTAGGDEEPTLLLLDNILSGIGGAMDQWKSTSRQSRVRNSVSRRDLALEDTTKSCNFDGSMQERRDKTRSHPYIENSVNPTHTSQRSENGTALDAVAFVPKVIT